MSRINQIKDLRSILDIKAMEHKVPILGICLGMQILTDKSEEGILDGLGWIPGEVLKFPNKTNFKVPHMGWNGITRTYKQNKLLNDISDNDRYYFVHSYYVKLKQERFSLMRSSHDITFEAAIFNKNIFGVQFHPEKSHRFGKKILKNFSEM